MIHPSQAGSKAGQSTRTYRPSPELPSQDSRQRTSAPTGCWGQPAAGHLSVHLSVTPSTCPSVLLTACLPTCPSVYLSTHSSPPSIHSSLHLSIHSSPLYLSIHSSARPSVCPFIRLSIYLPIYSPTRPSGASSPCQAPPWHRSIRLSPVPRQPHCSHLESCVQSRLQELEGGK